MMTWCYAGHALADFEAFAYKALLEAGLPERLNRELAPILDWTRSQGIRTTVISASAQPVVEQAAKLWGFSATDISASPAVIAEGVIQPRLAGPTPYAEAKCVAGRNLFGQDAWLASFGDNVFDIEMLLAAKLGVAVRPKRALRIRLEHLPNVFLLA
jgi:phosphoserine phosphatase